MKTTLVTLIAVSIALLLCQKELPAQTWTNKANLPQSAHPNGGRSFGVAALNGKFYTVGGLNWPNAIATVLEYDPALDAWTNKANMLVPRYATAAVAVNGKLYALGGQNGSGMLATVEEYDPATDTWTNKASMSQARFVVRAVTLNGKIYVLGGQDNGVTLASVEAYDPVSNTWSPKANMPAPRTQFGVAVANGKIYVVGGDTYGGGPIAAVYEYDPSSNTWATKANIPTTRGAPAAVGINGRILVLGGNIGMSVGSAAVEEYDPVANLWVSKPNMPTGRNECFAVNICDSLYVFGGYDTWSMQALTVPPPYIQISAHPQPAEAQTNGTATFSVTVAAETPVAFQWRLDAVPIPNATNSQLTLSNLTIGNFGIYSVVLTSCSLSVTSNPAKLWLYADTDGDGLRDYIEAVIYGTDPLKADTDGDGFNDYAEIYAGKDPNNPADFPAALLSAFTAIELEFVTQTNKTYYIQSSPNLTNWTNFDGPIVGTGNIWSKTYSTRPQGKLFYRVELTP